MKNHSAILNRMFMVFGLVLLVPFTIGLQLVRVNFVEGDELRQLWNEQAIDYIPIPAQRGNIYDEDGSLLVTNNVVYKAAIDPKINGLTSDQISQVCDSLAKYTGQSARFYRQKINRAPNRSRYVVLNKRINTEAYQALQQLDIRGVILEEEYKRKYNFETLAAHTLGFVNHDLTGMSGLEKEYNEKLSGEDGVQQVRRDRNGRIYAYLGAPRKQPRQGYSLHTTIDSHIQAIVEEELKAGIEKTRSTSGSAIVMDPQTGAIKAMANYPTFNPNNPASLDKTNRRNFTISDMIEPGSTFKLVTAIAAVEQNKVKLNEQFETPEDGKTLIHGQWMRDHDPLGTLSFPEVIQKSSNIATAEIAMRLSKDAFYQYARNLGFGTPTNIDLPNEKSGRLSKPYEWSQVSLPWMSIGYELQVTPIQLAQAYAAFANGGTMMRPYLVKQITNGQGNIVSRTENVPVREIAKKSTIEKLYPIFKDVVSDSGTANYAQVPGLSIVGKTGTAQKYIDGQYRNEYRSSFVGVFPAENPKYVTLIVLDDPDTYPPYGGVTAGPIFRETANRIAGLDDDIEKQILQQEQDNDVWAYTPNLKGLTKEDAQALLTNQNLSYEFDGTGDWVVDQSPDSGNELSPKDNITLSLSNSISQNEVKELSEGYSTIPDVGGMSMRKASVLLNSRGFEIKMIGSGTIYTQFPRPGDTMKHGRTVTVRGKAKPLESLTTNGVSE
ncbi:penicillin-binding transpeptidase domain-containing protein [Fodinibius sp. Rm-B-1B1-1]|uniref:penicillin-binding transpeptidase domain-containing protein n=1 Tax=Fodinibius alkaliphilus TaxID=3140241 RepID=UPI00315AF478